MPDTETPSLKNSFFVDLDRELTVTRTVLAALPEKHFDWKPHPKSMSMIQLAIHVAHLPQWTRDTLAADEFNFSDAELPPKTMASRNDLLAYFDRNAAALRQTVARFDPATLSRTWTMRNGARIIASRPRDFVARVWCLNHFIHHRAQLCLYLRLLDTPVPTVYFNTADDPSWKME
jgi:uncharacterized damage-inducible protein DinB